jgi:ABC-type multidrug transport system fused ATPase/permease subunit
MHKNIFTSLSQLWLNLKVLRRRQFMLLFIFTVMSAFVEIISLGAVIPFLGVLSSPETIYSQPFVADISSIIGVNTAEQLTLPLTIIFIVAAVFAAVFRLLLLKIKTILVYATGTELSEKVYRHTLYQPYKVHLLRNSSEVISSITGKVSGVIGILDQVAALISGVVLIAFILVVLVVIDPLIASITFLILGAVYYTVGLKLRLQLTNNARLIADGRTQVVKTLQEGLGGIRDITLDGTQEVYLKLHYKVEYSLRKAIGNNFFIAGSPRYVIDAIGMTFIALLAYSLSLQPGGFSSAIPMLGALALGAQRLIPSMQQCYSAWSNIMGSQASLTDVLGLLNQEIPKEYNKTPDDVFDFQRQILFKNIRFSYNDNPPWVLDDLNLIIKKGTRIGLVGNTGCGKSTTLDILMGLLQASKGQVLIDNVPLTNENRRVWQKSIAHVPQNIYLSDNSMAENIAFGIPLVDIDMEKVKSAAQQAQIDEFIENKTNAYKELVGEHGIRLSGGQRQRIGIARALYKNAEVLIFDEATSALDNVTEKLIMESIDNLSRDLTIIIIAHRLTTLIHCDSIYELDKGKVLAQGSYQLLLKESPSFKKMVNIVSSSS